MRFLLCVLVVFSLPAAEAQTAPGERVVESIVPRLDSNSSCWSAVELQNLGNREVAAEVEAHKSTGALAPLVGRSGIQVYLSAGEHAEYKLQLPEESTGAWVRVRETIPDPQLSPVLAVSGVTECLTGSNPGSSNELRTTVREVASPVRNPWFSGNVSQSDDGIVALINTSESPAKVSGCYSHGVLYSVPDDDHPAPSLKPVCSETIREMVPPFGSAQYPVSRDGNSHFSLNALGDAIVLQMLRPPKSSVKVYSVDSTITFGKEVSDR